MEAEKIKMSKGAAILTWLMLIVYVLAALGLVDPKGFFACYKFLPHGVVLAYYCVEVFLTSVGILAIIGILRLKERMRRIAVAIGVWVTASETPIFFWLHDLNQSCYEAAELWNKEHPTQLLNVDFLAKVQFNFAISLALGAMVLNLIFIWYFTRPNIKKQFK